MRILRLILAAVLLPTACLALGSTAASAGGPTSVLLTSPGTGAAAALHITGSDDYATLEEKLHDVGPMSEPGSPRGADITATWLIHDVMVWRVDLVRVRPDGTVAVSTATSNGDQQLDTLGEQPWMLVQDPGAVIRILDRLGLTKQPAGVAASPAGAEPEASAEPETSAEPAVASPAPTSAPTPTARASSLWWGIGGLVLGVVLSLVAVGTRRRLRGASAG